jgi:hypothetical protein
MPLSDYSQELQQRIKQAKTVNEKSKIIRGSDEYKQRVDTQGTRMAASAAQRKAQSRQNSIDAMKRNLDLYEAGQAKLTPQQLAASQKEGNAVMARRAAERKANEEATARKNTAFMEQKNREDLASAAAMKAKNLAITRAAGIPDSPDVYKKGGSVKSASSRADGCAIRGKTRA